MSFLSEAKPIRIWFSKKWLKLRKTSFIKSRKANKRSSRLMLLSLYLKNCNERSLIKIAVVSMAIFIVIYFLKNLPIASETYFISMELLYFSRLFDVQSISGSQIVVGNIYQYLPILSVISCSFFLIVWISMSR